MTPDRYFRTCDFLVIGGGSAGCILARRLADARAGSVILVEAGKSDEKEPVILQLDRLSEQGPELNWAFRARPHQHSHKQLDYLRAKMLGGCANHNDCAFLKPPDSDFDHWAKLGATGWDPSSVAPFFQRVESMVEIDRSPPVSPVSHAFLDAGRQTGLASLDFRATIDQGIGVFPLNVSANQRSASSTAYLHPLHKLPSDLEVICDTVVTRLKMENGRVISCETDKGEIGVRQEVLLCCGSIQTPQLLMVSGIGPAHDLSEFGLEVKKNLPGVGQNLADHVAANLVMELDVPVQPWKLTPCEVTMMITSDKRQPAPDLLYHFVLEMRDKYGDAYDHPDFSKCVKIAPNVTRPKSRGHVKIQSSDFRDKPEIQLNYFSDQDDYDMKTMLEGLRFARKLIRAPAFEAIAKQEVLPGVEVVDDEDLANYVRETCDTVYHPAGTCKIGNPGSDATVVHPDLKVVGFENLRVCDASVFPSMVTVNINNTVMMVAEKAADLVLNKGCERFVQ